MRVILLAIFCLFTNALTTTAQASELREFTPRDRAPLSVSQNGAAVSVMGQDEEKGLIEFFVRKNNNLQAREDAIARELNGIEPAAGIQFRLEF